ncbi:hypothetical protein GCM10027456_72240 [Kineosporia babensis]
MPGSSSTTRIRSGLITPVILPSAGPGSGSAGLSGTNRQLTVRFREVKPSAGLAGIGIRPGESRPVPDPEG